MENNVDAKATNLLDAVVHYNYRGTIVRSTKGYHPAQMQDLHDTQVRIDNGEAIDNLNVDWVERTVIKGIYDLKIS